MKAYSLARALYRGTDRALLRHLPTGLELRVRRRILWLAQRWYGPRIQASSAADLAADSRGRRHPESLPAWAVREVGALAQIEPQLAALVAPDARLEHYSIPWDKVQLGEAWHDARVQLHPPYASAVIAGGVAAAAVDAYLAGAPHRALLVDVDGDPRLAALAAGRDADYLVLVKSWFDDNDRAALLTRLVLQLHPGEVRCAEDPFIAHCLARHGLAMRAVTSVAALDSKGGGACADA